MPHLSPMPSLAGLPNVGATDVAKLLVQRMGLAKAEIGLEKAKVDLERTRISSSATKFTAGVGAVGSALSTVQFLVTEIVSYQKQRLEHDRALAEIDNERVLELERIAAQKGLLQAYMEKAFSERRLVLDTFLDGLDRGIAAGDTALVETMAAQLVEVVRAPVLSRMAEAASAMETGAGITLGGRRG